MNNNNKNNNDNNDNYYYYYYNYYYYYYYYYQHYALLPVLTEHPPFLDELVIPHLALLLPCTRRIKFSGKFTRASTMHK